MLFMVAVTFCQKLQNCEVTLNGVGAEMATGDLPSAILFRFKNLKKLRCKNPLGMGEFVIKTSSLEKDVGTQLDD